MRNTGVTRWSNWKYTGLLVTLLAVFLLASGIVAAAPIPVQDYEFSVLQQAAETYVSRSPRLVASQFVLEKIVREKSPDYWLISLCAPQDHQKGHLPEANLVPRVAFAGQATWNKLPAGKKLVSYCYTGVGSGYMTTFFTMAGYDAYSLAFGLTNWTTNATVIVNPARPTVSTAYPVELRANLLTQEYPTPSLQTGKLDAQGIALVKAQEYLGSKKLLSIDAKEVKTTLLDDGDSDKYLIIDIRNPAQYAKGHIPSAVNIPWADTMKLQWLKKLPVDKLLVVVDEDGQSASMVAALYNLLGYQSRVLLYGMMNWTNDPAVIGKPLWQPPQDYPLIFPASKPQ